LFVDFSVLLGKAILNQLIHRQLLKDLKKIIRGAEKSVQGLKFDPDFTIKVILEQAHCDGNETSFSDCKLTLGSNCASIQDQVVGVKCRQNPQALCKSDEHLFGNTCYKILTHNNTNRTRARTLCKEDEGELLQIHSQV